MNINASLIGRSRIRNKHFRRKGQNVVNIQRPLKTVSNYKTPTRTSSSSSALRWKEPSSSKTWSVTRSATSSRSNSSYETNSRIVLALSQGRGEATYEVGIAVINVSKPSLILCQISDSPSYVNTLTKINILNPNEILVPLTFIRSSTTNRLLEKVKDHFKETTITAVDRISFNKITGIQYIQKLCAPQWNSILLVLQHKYYCLAAAGALLNYAEFVLYVRYTEQSLRVEYEESEGFTIIDVSTADNLELVASASNRSDKRYSSLFGILNHCQTKIGARTLRASILQPPCTVPDIESRLDCITELKRNSNMLGGVQVALSKLANVDQLLTLATIFSEQQETSSGKQLNYILTLNSVLEFINPLKELLENSTQRFFIEFCETLSSASFDVMRKLIRLLIHTDARPAKGEQGCLQRCFAIKPGVNGLLDLVRKSYSERIEDMKEYVKELGEKYNLPLTLGNTSKKGYHIILTLNQQTKKTFKKSDLNPEFFQVERLSSTVTMKTIKLINYTVRVEDIQIEVMKLSNIMIHQLFIELRAYIGLFYKLCEDVAKLDMLQSLAQASCNVPNIRPKFDDYMELVDARHPLLDFLCNTEPVPNSILVSKYKNIHIITGPNNSGKSIFIRQVLLLQIMAQVGCFIPARRAIFRPCDRIFARVQFDDNMECNASSFVLEIKEMQYFRTVLTENTLIIVDELCRSTAVGEGTALAVAMCEDLAKTHAYVFFATHYIFMTNMADVYPNVQNWQMETMEEKHGDAINLKFTYNLISGVTTTKNYGLFAANTVWPKSIVENAKELFTKTQHASISSGAKKMEDAFRLKYDLETEFNILKLKNELDLTVLASKLAEYFGMLKELGYDLDDDDNVTLTMHTQQVPPGNLVETPQKQVREPHQTLASNFNKSLENMSSNLTSHICAEGDEYGFPETPNKINIQQASESQEILFNNFNRSLENMPLSNIPYVCTQEKEIEELYFEDCPNEVDIDHVPLRSEFDISQTESQQILASNFNRSLENMSLSDTSYIYAEAVYSQAGSEQFEEFNIPKTTIIMSTQLEEGELYGTSFEFPGKMNDAKSDVKDQPLTSSNSSNKTFFKIGNSFPRNEALNPEVSVAIEDFYENDFKEHHIPITKKDDNIGVTTMSQEVRVSSSHLISFDNKWEDVLSKTTEKGLFSSSKIQDKDPNIVQTFQEVQESSAHFTSSVEEWEDALSRISEKTLFSTPIEDTGAEIARTLQEVQELSAHLTSPVEEWEEVLSGTDSKTQLSTPIQAAKKHVLIKSVHTFDKYDKLVDIQLHPPPKNKSISKESPQRKTNQEIENETRTDSTESITYSPICSIEVFNESKEILPVKQDNSTSVIEDNSSPINSTSLISPNVSKESGEIFATPSVPPKRVKRGKFKTPVKSSTLLTFKPPKPLTKREILTSYHKTLEKYLETSNDEESAARNMQRIINMPSVDQLRQQKYLAKLRKTDDGIVVIPATMSEKRPKQQVPLKRKFSADFNKTFLSDKNTNKFLDYLNNKKDDGFVFEFDKEVKDFDIFQQKEVDQNNSQRYPLTIKFSQNTPSGYYKENKSGINDMLNKYL